MQSEQLPGLTGKSADDIRDQAADAGRKTAATREPVVVDPRSNVRRDTGEHRTSARELARAGVTGRITSASTALEHARVADRPAEPEIKLPPGKTLGWLLAQKRAQASGAKELEYVFIPGHGYVTRDELEQKEAAADEAEMTADAHAQQQLGDVNLRGADQLHGGDPTSQN